jgi:hypothetical protein
VKNPSGKKLEKLVFGMFDQMIEGADKYVTEQGSTWLIFTKEKKWAVEFTNDKTLWFNYNLFKSELELIGKDCTEERDFIKNWFESRFLGIKPDEDTLQNGVRHTYAELPSRPSLVEDTIQNGVRHTRWGFSHGKAKVEDTIQNGVRQTNKRLQKPFRSIKDAIQNGVKDTKLGAPNNRDYFIEDTIENGVKHTVSTCKEYLQVVEDTIQNGICDVKHSCDFEKIVVKDIIEDSYPHKHRVEGVIRNTNKDGI